MNPAEPADMSLNRHIVWRIGEHHCCPLLAHQALQAGEVEHAAAADTVLAEGPEVAGLADGIGRRGEVSQPVIGDSKRADLCLVQVVGADGWDHQPAEFAAGEDPAGADDDIVVAIDYRRRE